MSGHLLADFHLEGTLYLAFVRAMKLWVLPNIIALLFVALVAFYYHKKKKGKK